MNYKVAKTMLILCIVYLVGFYILKFIFPELLIQAITSPTLLRLGEFMNSWKGYTYIFRSITCFITLLLFVCASKGNIAKKWDYAYIVGGVIILNIVELLIPELYVHTSTAVILIIAWLCKGKLGNTVISFTLHGYLSQFLLSIRGFETYMVLINSISAFILTLEAFVWLLLLAIIFYIKERSKNERMVSPVHKQAR